MSSLRERSTVPSASRLTTSCSRSWRRLRSSWALSVRGNGERLAERGVGQADQLLTGLFTDAGVTFTVLQPDLPDAQLAAVQPDKGAADPLIVLDAPAAGKMNIERDAHAVLQRPAEGLRNNHPANLLRAWGSRAGVGLNEQKYHAEGKPRFQSSGKSVVEASSLSICTTVYFTGTNCSPCQSATRPFYLPYSPA